MAEMEVGVKVTPPDFNFFFIIFHKDSFVTNVVLKHPAAAGCFNQKTNQHLVQVQCFILWIFYTVAHFYFLHFAGCKF